MIEEKSQSVGGHDMGLGNTGLPRRWLFLSIAIFIIFEMTVLTQISASPLHDSMNTAPQVMTGSQWSLYDLSSVTSQRLCGEYRNNGFSQSITGEEPVSQRVRVEVDLSDLASRSTFPVDTAILPSTITPYLIRSQGSEKLDGLSHDLTSDSRTVFDAVVTILCWVSNEITYERGENLPERPDEVLISRRANCVGSANLAVSLLRSVGIPARCVRGLYFPRQFDIEDLSSIRQEMSLEKGGLHRWLEVYYPDSGWVFCDPLRSANHVDDRYLVFHLEQPLSTKDEESSPDKPGWLGLRTWNRSGIDPGSVIVTRMEQGGVLYPLDVMPHHSTRHGMTIRRNEAVRFRPGMVGRIVINAPGTPEPDRVELVRLQSGRENAEPIKRQSRIGESLFSFTNLMIGRYRLRFFHELRLLAEKTVEVTFPPQSEEPFTITISNPTGVVEGVARDRL